eukprot:gene41590-51520_t
MSFLPMHSDLAVDSCLLIPSLCEFQRDNRDEFSFLTDTKRYSFLRALLQSCSQNNLFLANEALRDLFILSGVSFLDYMREGLISGVNGRSVLRELRDKTGFALLSMFERKSQLTCSDIKVLDEDSTYNTLLFRKNGSVCSLSVVGRQIVISPVAKGFLYMVFH